MVVRQEKTGNLQPTMDYATPKPEKKYVTFTSHYMWFFFGPVILALLLSWIIPWIDRLGHAQ